MADLKADIVVLGELPRFARVCVLSRQYSTSTSVADSLCADLATAAAAADASSKQAALAHFASTVRAQTGQALNFNQAEILLHLINYL